MSTFIGYSGNYPVFSDSQGCFYTDDMGFDVPVACPQSNSIPVSATPIPTYPVGGGGLPIQAGGSWYNDLLNTILGITAIENKGSISAQGVNVNKTPVYNPLVGQPYQGQNVGANLGGNLGGSLQSFVTNNSMLLLVGGVIYLLWSSGRSRR